MTPRRLISVSTLLLLCSLALADLTSAQVGASAGALAVRWRAKLESGYSGIAVAGGRAVTMFADGPRDVLAAFDSETGKEAGA